MRPSMADGRACLCALAGASRDVSCFLVPETFLCWNEALDMSEGGVGSELVNGVYSSGPLDPTTPGPSSRVE